MYNFFTLACRCIDLMNIPLALAFYDFHFYTACFHLQPKTTYVVFIIIY